MDKYRIIRKGLIQSIKSFEEQINGMAAEGWKVVTASSDNGSMYVIMERQR
jgi:hypothetical protein